jgi:hypothetical protein
VTPAPAPVHPLIVAGLMLGGSIILLATLEPPSRGA